MKVKGVKVVKKSEVKGVKVEGLIMKGVKVAGVLMLLNTEADILPFPHSPYHTLPLLLGTGWF